ncbi:Ankyrin repeat protein [Penicillium frequentans]|nr:Ankyrin repeat protein [Penicillium glabrum]
MKLTPLHAAAGFGHAQVVAVLLDAGFDQDAQDENGMTALATAVQQGHPDVIILLLEKEAKDLPDDRREHALDHAVVMCAGKDNDKILKLLRGAHFAEMKLSSQISELYHRRNGWKLGILGLWALRRALK